MLMLLCRGRAASESLRFLWLPLCAAGSLSPPASLSLRDSALAASIALPPIRVRSAPPPGTLPQRDRAFAALIPAPSAARRRPAALREGTQVHPLTTRRVCLPSALNVCVCRGAQPPFMAAVRARIAAATANGPSGPLIRAIANEAKKFALAIQQPAPDASADEIFVLAARNSVIQASGAAHPVITQRRASLYANPILRVVENEALSWSSRRTQLEPVLSQIQEQERIRRSLVKGAERARKQKLEKRSRAKGKRQRREPGKKGSPHIRVNPPTNTPEGAAAIGKLSITQFPPRSPPPAAAQE